MMHSAEDAVTEQQRKSILQLVPAGVRGLGAELSQATLRHFVLRPRFHDVGITRDCGPGIKRGSD